MAESWIPDCLQLGPRLAKAITQCETFGLERRTDFVNRWSARAKSEGSPKPRKQGRPAGKGPLVAHLDYLIAVVEAAPDITMPELAAKLQAERGVVAAWASLSKLLCRAGFTYKKTVDGLGMRTR